MKTQRLRNLTTGRLHTDISCVYQDLEFITGMEGLMTHQLPRVMRAIAPWLREKVVEPEYWNGDYAPTLKGDYPLEPMTDTEQKEMYKRYNAQPDPLENKEIVAVLREDE